MIQVSVLLVDINDNDPVFLLDSSDRLQRQLVLELSESAPTGTILRLPAADDPDAGQNGKLHFSYESNCSSYLDFQLPIGEEGHTVDDDSKAEEEWRDDVIEGRSGFAYKAAVLVHCASFLWQNAVYVSNSNTSTTI